MSHYIYEVNKGLFFSVRPDLFKHPSHSMPTRKIQMEIMATWVREGKSEFFNRWLVVGVPRGAAVGVTGAAYSLHHSGGFRGGVTGCVGTERCSVKVNYSSHIPNLSPPSQSPTRLFAPTREVRSLCPTPCPLSSCATFHSHLSPVLSVSLFASLPRTASTQIPLTLAVILCSTLTRSGRTRKGRNSVLFFLFKSTRNARKTKYNGCQIDGFHPMTFACCDSPKIILL